MAHRVAFVVVALLAAVAGAQHQERITVNLVQVPVYVSYRGAPVTGLTRDDFELYVNGERQSIDYFDVVDRRDAPAPATPIPSAPSVAPAPLEQRRLYVLLFDLLHAQPHRLQQAKAAAQKAVTTAPAGDAFAVATLGSALRFVVPFTTDRVALERAIATLQPSRAGDALQLATLEIERSAWTRATAPTHGWWDAPGVASPSDVDLFRMNERLAQEQENVRLRSTFDVLGALADRLAPLSGSKHVILISEGLSAGSTGVSSVQMLDRMHQRFRAAGVILDAVFIGTPIAPWPSSDKRASTPESIFALDTSSSLYAATLSTGGTVARHSNIAKSLQSLRDMQSVAYVLSFRPPKDARARNAIRVVVPRQRFGTVVQYRRGFATTRDDSPDDGLLLADILMNDIPQGGVTLDVAVERDPEGAIVAAAIPGSELLARLPDKTVTLEVFLYVFDAQNVVAGWDYSRLSIDLEKGRDVLAQHPYVVRNRFRLGAGTYAAKALVRVVGTDAVGFRRAPFDVPRVSS